MTGKWHKYSYNLFLFFDFDVILFLIFFCRCEAFSTYPRTYDLIHANGIFTLYKDR
jgi:hypothetical protein